MYPLFVLPAPFPVHHNFDLFGALFGGLRRGARRGRAEQVGAWAHAAPRHGAGDGRHRLGLGLGLGLGLELVLGLANPNPNPNPNPTPNPNLGGAGEEQEVGMARKAIHELDSNDREVRRVGC